MFSRNIPDALIYHSPSFSPFPLDVMNFAHNLDGEDGISAGDGCLHVVVASLSALPKIAETIPMSKRGLSR